jgi:hypothetical protein
VQDKKLTNLDEGAIKNIIGEFEEDEALDDKDNSTNDTIAIQKAKHRVQLRLAMEKKAAARKGNRKGGGNNGENDDDDNHNNDLRKMVQPPPNQKRSKTNDCHQTIQYKMD